MPLRATNRSATPPLEPSVAVGLTGADLLSLFGEQPLDEINALSEFGNLPGVDVSELNHLLPMSLFQLRHLILQTIGQGSIG